MYMYKRQYNTVEIKQESRTRTTVLFALYKLWKCTSGHGLIVSNIHNMGSALGCQYRSIIMTYSICIPYRGAILAI